VKKITYNKKKKVFEIPKEIYTTLYRRCFETNELLKKLSELFSTSHPTSKVAKIISKGNRSLKIFSEGVGDLVEKRILDDASNKSE